MWNKTNIYWFVYVPLFLLLAATEENTRQYGRLELSFHLFGFAPLRLIFYIEFFFIIIIYVSVIKQTRVHSATTTTMLWPTPFGLFTYFKCLNQPPPPSAELTFFFIFIVHVLHTHICVYINTYLY